MLDVVAGIGEERVRNRCCMAIQTGSLGVHTARRIMVYVMGEQVQRTGAIIYSAVTRGTVSSAASSAGSCCYQAVVVNSRINVTRRTGVMDRVVGRINKGYVNRRVMAGIAVTGNRKRYAASGNVVDGVSTRIGVMTALAIARSG